MRSVFLICVAVVFLGITFLIRDRILNAQSGDTFQNSNTIDGPTMTLQGTNPQSSGPSSPIQGSGGVDLGGPTTQTNPNGSQSPTFDPTNPFNYRMNLNGGITNDPVTACGTNSTLADSGSSQFQLVHRCSGGPLLNTNSQALGKKPVCECTFSDVLAQIYLIVRFALWLMGFYAVAVLMYAGYLYMTSQGNAAKVSKAKTMLLDILIGLIVIILAFYFVSFLLDAFKVDPSYRGIGSA